MQRRGTAKVAALFGPIILMWFAVLAIIGVVCIAQEPRVLAAFNPIHGTTFLLQQRADRVHRARAWSSSPSRVPRRSTPISGISAASRSRPLGSAWRCRRSPQLPGTGRARARQPGRDRKPLFPDVSGLGVVAGRTPHHYGHGDRQPGRDNRRLFCHPAGHPARAPAARRHSPHVRRDGRPDLPAARQLAAARRRAAAGRRLQELQRAGRRLWRCGDGHDDHDLLDGVLRLLEAVAMARVAGCRPDRAAACSSSRCSSPPTSSRSSKARGCRWRSPFRSCSSC